MNELLMFDNYIVVAHQTLPDLNLADSIFLAALWTVEMAKMMLISNGNIGCE